MFSIELFIIFFLVLVIVGLILFYFLHTKKKITDLRENAMNLTNVIDAIRYGNLYVKTSTLNPYFQDLSDSINRMTETFSDRERMKSEAQAELISQNKLLTSIMEVLSEGLILVDNNFKILRVSSKIENWVGKEEKALRGEYLFDYVTPKQKKKYKKYDGDDVKIKKSKLKFKATIVDLKTVEDNDFYLCLIKDVTVEKELQKVKEDFVAAITHDLKVPLLAQINILNFLQEGKFGDISEKQKRVIAEVVHSAEDLLTLTRNILDGYRIGNGTFVNNFEKTNLLDLIKSVNDLFLPILEKEDRILKIDVSPNIYVNVDSLNIRRVIGNLIQNAISHTKKGDEISITSYQANNYVVVSIKDKGIGIARDKMDKIFEKFYTTNNNFNNLGTGLGLHVVKEIVKAHDGTIFVSSEEDEGTEFGVYLPLMS